MRILFLTQYFPPEVGAPQTRIYELANKLMERGHDVRILTAFPNYPTGIVPEEYRGRFFAREEYKGIKVYRSYIYETPNSGFFKRLIAQLSFAFSSFLAFIRIKNEFHPEMSVVESPPLFAAFTAILMRFLFGVRYIFNVADIWPDAAVDLG
ncbi:MAG TPA: glycosyltransferase, partial [Candidatus Wallbacteria bacterium]|nr:glycosyltransferase [Candidatus Wallbacteria bacterium]